MEKGKPVDPMTQAGAALALGWPQDAFARILAGADPADLPVTTPTATLTVEGRVAALETELAEIRGLVESLVRAPRSGRAR